MVTDDVVPKKDEKHLNMEEITVKKEQECSISEDCKVRQIQTISVKKEPDCSISDINLGSTEAGLHTDHGNKVPMVNHEKVMESGLIGSLHDRHIIKDEFVLGTGSVQEKVQDATVKQQLKPQLRQCWVLLKRIRVTSPTPALDTPHTPALDKPTTGRDTRSDVSVGHETFGATANASRQNARHCRVRLERMPGLDALLKRDMWRDTRHTPATHKQPDKPPKTNLNPHVKTFECDTCGRPFQWKNNLIRHFQVHSKLEKKDIHDKTVHVFADSRHFASHKRTHSDEKPFSCEICKKRFTRSAHLTRHKRMHTGEKPYSCEVCNKCFAYSSSLKEHSLRHFFVKTYSCKICKETFTEKNDLQTHRKVHKKVVSCDICNLVLKNARNLKLHIRTHTNERPYPCTTCGKKFKQSSHLNTHTLIHKGDKPFACEICKMRFYNANILKAHMRTHSEEKPYSCGICKKSFTLSSYLKSHTRVHMSVKPYSCNICKKKFAHSRTLQHHKRSCDT